MASDGNKVNPELETFREKWISDLQLKRETTEPSHRAAEPASSISASASASSYAVTASRRQRRNTGPQSPTSAKKHAPVTEDDEGYAQIYTFDEPPEPSEHTLADPPGKESAEKPLVSALDHYEEAMEKEAQGNMGDSLRLYRKAYRLDHRVDKSYREKHFPGGFTAAPKGVSPSAGTSSTQKPESIPKPDEPPRIQSIEELIASFADLKIEPAPPLIENTPPPPCPISNLPSELLVHILQDVAVADVGDFVRLSLVCKQFAYLVAKEQRIWKRVCLGTEFGFTDMHRHWRTGIEWAPLESEEEEGEDGLLISLRELDERRRLENVNRTHSLYNPAAYPSWKNMFRHRPRIRFNGCYISTVNYVRTGQASTNQATWGGSPIHIVTYYRYLRFFRDGTALSLLTTAAPIDVVHHLTPELLMLHRDSHHAHLPSAVMSQALRGRWRLSSEVDFQDSSTNPKDQEEDIYVETEGVISKYIYRMNLSFRSASKGAKNNKFIWREFYSYNKLTDDWAQFQLKNDKPFFFSRVKSYGVGEIES